VPVVSEAWLAACESVGELSCPAIGDYAPTAVTPVLSDSLTAGGGRFSLRTSLLRRAAPESAGGIFAGRTIYFLPPNGPHKDYAEAVTAGGGSVVVVSAKTDLAALVAASGPTPGQSAAPAAFAVWILPSQADASSSGAASLPSSLSTDAARVLAAGVPIYASTALTHASLEQHIDLRKEWGGGKRQHLLQAPPAAAAPAPAAASRSRKHT
jgi:hypothetical protein